MLKQSTNNNLAYFYIMTADHLVFISHPKYLIKNLEQRSLKIIGNSNLKLPSAENLIQHKISQFVFCCLRLSSTVFDCLRLPSTVFHCLRLFSTVFDCLLCNVCTPFKTYFERPLHSKNTRNDGLSVKLPKMRIEFGKESFHYQGAKIFNKLPIEFRPQKLKWTFLL